MITTLQIIYIKILHLNQISVEQRRQSKYILQIIELNLRVRDHNISSFIIDVIFNLMLCTFLRFKRHNVNLFSKVCIVHFGFLIGCPGECKSKMANARYTGH